MRRSVLAFVVVGVLISTSVPPAGAGPSTPDVPFVTVAQGRTSGMRQPFQVVIRERDGWLALWRRHAGSAAVAPSVDFAREMVIAIFGGAVAGAHTVTITRIARGSTQLTVWYVIAERSPLPDGGGQAPATPFHIVRLPRSPLPVVFLQAKTVPVNSEP